MPKLALIVLYSQKKEELRCFYEKIGLEFIEERHGKGEYRYSAAIGETTLEIYPLPPNVKITAIRLGFSLRNMEELLHKLSREGVRIASFPKATPWGKRAVIEDPEGRMVELYEEKQTA